MAALKLDAISDMNRHTIWDVVVIDNAVILPHRHAQIVSIVRINGAPLLGFACRYAGAGADSILNSYNGAKTVVTGSPGLMQGAGWSALRERGRWNDQAKQDDKQEMPH